MGPHPDASHLWLSQVTSQKGIKVATEEMVANQLTLQQENNAGLSGKGQNNDKGL